MSLLNILDPASIETERHQSSFNVNLYSSAPHSPLCYQQKCGPQSPICFSNINVASKSCQQIILNINQLIIYTAQNNISNPFPQVVTFSCTIWHPQRWKQLKICQLKFLYGGRGSERPLRTWNSANHNLLGCSQSVSFFFVLFCSNIFTIYRSSRCFVPESWPSGSVFDSLRWSETEPNAATRRSDTPDPLLTHSQQMKTSTRHGSTMWHSGAIELVNKPHPHPPGSLGEKKANQTHPELKRIWDAKSFLSG